jgi:hypothetical protein
MVTDQSLETLIGRADPILITAWQSFIREQDSRFARIARDRGEPYSNFDDAEVREVARMAAALGVTPADSLAFENRQPDDVAAKRVPVAAG